MSKLPTLVRIITWLPVGGIERRLVAVAPRLAERGWPVRVVCLREEGPLAADLKAAGVPVDVIPFRSRLSPPGIRGLAAYLRQQGAGVVHTHMYRSNVPGTLAARLAGVRAIFGQVHNVDSWDNGRQVLMERLIAPLRTGTFAVSQAVQADVMANLRQPAQRVPVLYNGIDTEAFRPDRDAGEKVRAELGLAPGELLFVVPARLHQQKNPLGVLEAFARALEARGGDGARLAFAGGGKMEGELHAAAAERGLRGKVFFLGNRNDMASVYNAADAVVLSSFKEGFSNAVVEALACGKPMIASRVGGNAEAVDRPEVGWIHEAGDGEALAVQLLEAMDRGPVGLAKMAKDCRARGQAFSLEALVEATHRHYCVALGVAP